MVFHVFSAGFAGVKHKSFKTMKNVTIMSRDKIKIDKETA